MASGRLSLLRASCLAIGVLAAADAMAATPPATSGKPTTVTVGPGGRKKSDPPTPAPTDTAGRKEMAGGKEDAAGKEASAEKKEAAGGKEDAAQAGETVAGKADRAVKKGEPRDKEASRKKGEAASSSPKAGGTGKKGEAAADAPAEKEEPAGPLTPPIKMAAMRDEMSRPPRKDERPMSHAERDKLEQLAAEINKAREGLRQDTARLEATLAARDAAQQAGASGNAAATDGASDGGPTKKIPSPLDNLAKAMRGMKPEQAAPIISRVDRKLAADVLLRMPATDAGKVLGVCKPEVAAELAAEIASRAPHAPHAELKR